MKREIINQVSRLWHFTDFIGSNKKKNQQHDHVQTTLLLPNQIGCRIIQMEMLTVQTQNLTKQLIMDLLSQYNKAIQFYEERGSQKYLLYQKKLQNFIMRPSVTEVLKGNTGTFLLKKQKNEEELKKIQLHSHSQVRKILQNSEHSGKKQQQIIHTHLQSQQKSLQQRLQRKRAMSNSSKRKKITTASFSVPTSQRQLPLDSNDVCNFVSSFVDILSPQHGSESKNQPKKLAF